MDTIQLKTEMTFEQYQMAINLLKSIGLEVDTKYSVLVSENELKAIERGREQIKKGEFTSSHDVRKKALELCMK